MAEVKQYIPISQLDETRTVNPTDVLIISQKENITDQEYVSKKINIDTFSSNINVPAAKIEQIGGFRLRSDSVEQNGKPYYVNLNDNNEAFVKVPDADGKTIIENNGKISVNKELKDLSENADNLVKKNVANAVIEAKDGKYIAGFEQKNGKIELSSVQYKDLADISGLSVVNTFDNASTTTVPSTALTKSSIQAVDSKFNRLHKVAYTGNYNDLIDKPENSGFVDLTSDQSNINGVKTFQKCPCSNELPSGQNEMQLVNVGYLKDHTNSLKLDEEVTFLWGNIKFGDKTSTYVENADGNINWINTPFHKTGGSTDNTTYNWKVEELSIVGTDKKMKALKLLQEWTNFDVIRICVGNADTKHYPTYFDVSVKKLIDLATRLRLAYGDSYTTTDLSQNCSTYLVYTPASMFRINVTLSLIHNLYFVLDIVNADSQNCFFNSIYGIKYVFKKV